MSSRIGTGIPSHSLAAINIQRAEFHGEWNYTISPNPHRPNRAPMTRCCYASG
jgi:hypothetical protein